MSHAPAVLVRVWRDVPKQRLQFEAQFPDTGQAWNLQLPTWRPGRYELGNFAQYLMDVSGVTADGQDFRLPKRGLHSWKVVEGVTTVRWTFHADILNAGSTCVEEDLYYVNPVNCFM